MSSHQQVEAEAILNYLIFFAVLNPHQSRVPLTENDDLH